MTTDTMEFTVEIQNMTEAAPPDEYWENDVLLLSETDHRLIKKHSPDEFNWYFPRRDSHQAIGWNTRTFRADDPPGERDEDRSTMFHASGKAEQWEIRTPSRWLHEVDLVHIDSGFEFTFGEMWWLNSWRKEKRRWRIIRLFTKPKVKERMEICRKRGRFGIYGGDTNNVVADFKNWFTGYRTAPRFGLDRIFWTAHWRLRLLNMRHGRKIGVGNQLRHKSIIAKFQINVRPKRRRK